MVLLEEIANLRALRADRTTVGALNARAAIMSVHLAHYLDQERCHGVRLTCLGCMGHRDLSLTAVILRLEALGLDGPRTAIGDVARFVREPCPTCGGKTFETSPAF